MSIEWHRCKNILCARLDQTGDVLMTTAAIKAVKETLPHCQLTLWCSPAGKEAAALVPEIDECIVYEAPWMKACGPPNAQSNEAMLKLLKSCRFDGAIIFTVFSQNPLPAALMCFLAGIPLRLAYCRENPYQLLTHWIKDPEVVHPSRHEVQRQLDLVAYIECFGRDPKLALHVPTENVQEVRKMLSQQGVTMNKPLVIVHPGASAPSRRYPKELFAEALNGISEKINADIVLTGTSSEAELINFIRSRVSLPVKSLAGELNFPQLCALISLASVLITNNTGPAHIAAATGTPVVDLYALTNPQHTPWRVPHRVLFYDVPCKYCYKSICPHGHNDCLRKIKPQSVVEAALELITEKVCIL